MEDDPLWLKESEEREEHRDEDEDAELTKQEREDERSLLYQSYQW